MGGRGAAFLPTQRIWRPFAVTVLRGSTGQTEVTTAAQTEFAADTWQDLSVDLPGRGDHYFVVQVHEVAPDRMAWSAPVFVTKL